MIVGAFTTHRDAPGGPMAYVTNVSSVSNLLRSSLYVLQTLLGDICLVGNITVALSLVAPLKMILFFFLADLSVLSRMVAQYMDNNSTDPDLDILCW